MDIELYTKNFKIYLFRLGYAQTTIKHNTNSLWLFLSYLSEQHVKELKQVEPKHIVAYNEHLHGLKSRITNLGLNGKTIGQKINVVRLFSQYLEATQQLKIFTTSVDIIPSVKKHKEILSREQIKNLYNQTDDSIMGLRDRALLGLYYGCGLRYTEGIKVEINHIDYKKELLFITPSKNYHSRYIPINNRILKDFKEYEIHARVYFTTPVLFKTLTKNTFITGSISNSYLNKWLQNLCNKANINKTITLHSLRHSIATHLLQQEMPLEQIARFLGHNTIRATQMYTHIVEELKHEKNGK